MQDVYKECPIIQNDRFLLRLVSENDVNDLLKVYGDKKALPYFNSDNCHGDNFYYPTKKKDAGSNTILAVGIFRKKICAFYYF